MQQQVGDEDGAAFSLNNIGAQSSEQRDYETAERFLQEARQRSKDPQIMLYVLVNLGEVARGLGDYALALQHVKECVRLSGELGNAWMQAHATINLGLLCQLSGDLPRAVEALQGGLDLVRRLRDRMLVAHCFEALAALASVTSQPESAARLFGAGGGLQASIGQTMSDHDAAIYGPDIDRVAAALGHPRYQQLKEEGRSLSLDQAFDLGQQVLSSASGDGAHQATVSQPA